MTEAALKIASDSKRRHRPRTGSGLFVTDGELSEILGIPEATLRPSLAMLDADKRAGFPQKQRFWGDRRYLPAVRAWLDKNNGIKVEPSKVERSHDE